MSTRFLSTLCRVWTLAVREGVSMVGWRICQTWDQTHSQGTLISRISSPVCPNSLATTRACRGLTPTCKCATVCRSHDWGPSMWSIQRQNYCVEQVASYVFCTLDITTWICRTESWWWTCYWHTVTNEEIILREKTQFLSKSSFSQTFKTYVNKRRNDFLPKGKWVFKHEF